MPRLLAVCVFSGLLLSSAFTPMTPMHSLMNLKASIESMYLVSSFAHFGNLLTARSISFKIGYNFLVSQTYFKSEEDTDIAEVDYEITST